MSLIKEELMSKARHPTRILWYDENISTDKTHPLHGMSQKDIDGMFERQHMQPILKKISTL